FVAGKVPKDPGLLGDTVLDDFTSFASGTTAQAPLPALRFTTSKTLTVAQSQFAHKTPRVEVLFDSGAGGVGAGDPQATYAQGFKTWPPPGAAVTYYLGTGATLSTKRAKLGSSTSLVLDPTVRPAIDLPSGNPWSAAPPWNWTTVPAVNGVAFETAPFTKDTSIIGPATLDLWVTSTAPVDDYQVTVTEVRPASSQEEYVTSGFLRSSNQVDLASSTKLFTSPSYLGSDTKDLSATTPSLVKIPLDPIAHTFRTGTELRIVISAPGGDRPSWVFDTVDNGQTTTLGLGGLFASTLVVDRSHAPNTPTAPACGVLRGEPCRAYQAEGNG
ncbi:MAG TPA: CocE/NonD family hydrolase C-terminal non-catalytic domain-containing protein, partial [Acidimicrobiales bacterium]|nr:CocE/NonD family hydrolase C-terminal non-catalytic domain-containing protein [Acidimicrobiales bacterium]